MGSSERETAEHAAPSAIDSTALCANVLVSRPFVVEFPLSGCVVFGRDADADLQLSHSSVSRRHAQLEMRGDQATVADLGSRNGTFVNGEGPLKGFLRVARGDEIAFGVARIVLLARTMVPAGVRPVLVRCALLSRLDAEIADGRELFVRVLRTPNAWFEIDAISAWLASLAPEAYAGILSDEALVVVGAGVNVDALRPDALEIQVGLARQTEVRAESGIDLVTAALRAIGATRAKRTDSRLVAVSPAMLRLYDEAAKIAPTNVSVLVIGETGVGKEVMARFLHERSGRRGPLVCVNTAALPEALVESELFGHERGAFSGALQAKTGLLEAANGGTLFLDEIGDLPLALQAKLLRVLEERTVRRVGATQERKIDVRVVAATHRDLERAVAEQSFRPDLLFRLNACTLQIPPLRERVVEIERLALELLNEAAGARAISLAPETKDLLCAYDWPGNVRELRNVIERGAALAKGAILPEHLPDYVRAPRAPSDPTSPAGVREDVKDFERQRIVDALAQTHGNQSQAAKLLGLPRRTLAYKMGRLGIKASE
jgi:DNA-binding NtrC family response regulator